MIRRFWMDDFWLPSWTTQTVDTDKYNVINGEIVPREDFKESLLRQKDEELKALDDYYARRKKEIDEDKKRIEGQRSLPG
jgi:hypothetical protein